MTGLVSDLCGNELTQSLKREGLRIEVPPFAFNLRTEIESLATAVAAAYGDYRVCGSSFFIDFTARVARARRLRPTAVFLTDGHQPFEPLPLDQAFPMLEWGLNWCVSSNCHNYVIAHAAVVERRGTTIVMPAPPGSGKSTLCAALVGAGWRLLSDELAILEPETGNLIAFPRPISLKNESIDLISRRFTDSCLVSQVRDTIKGTVGHLRPPRESVIRAHEPGQPGLLVFPKYLYNTATRLTPLERADAFLRLAQNTFNYDLLGELSFDTVADFVERAQCYEFEYADIDEAIRLFEKIC